MDPTLIQAIVNSLANVPGWAFAVWVYVYSINAHKAAIEYYKARVEALEAQVIRCYAQGETQENERSNTSAD